MFVEPSEKISAAYSNFWNELRGGNFKSGEYKRVAKGGNEIWIQASYNPIIDMNGKVFKVVKYATLITEQKLKNAYFEGQINAIGKSQAVIEFNVDGIIQWANDNFLNTVGYTLDEIKDKHHRMFVDKETRGSEEYSQFWADLKTVSYTHLTLPTIYSV